MKNRKHIKFLTMFKTSNTNGNRLISPAANTKSEYILKCLDELDYDVTIISPAYTQNSKGYFKSKIEKLNRNSKLISFNTFGTLFKKTTFIKQAYTLYQAKKYLLKNVNNKEEIIIYHTPIFYKLLRYLKEKKKAKIILEVEEIYADVNNNEKCRKKEEKMFELADKYIFVTKMLEEKINVLNKPYCIAHGTYDAQKQITKKFDDGKIHIVYSGIIDQVKSGAFMSVKIAKYLSDKYIMHIIGFGNDKDVKALKEMIDKENKLNNCKIVFDGVKRGDEYIKYIQKCDIGLSTQDPTEKYNETSFPSKILAYLSNGLRVVSVDIPAIRTSDVGELIHYYNSNDPRDVAKVIKSINFNEKYDSRQFIKKLDKDFKKKLMGVLYD